MEPPGLHRQRAAGRLRDACGVVLELGYRSTGGVWHDGDDTEVI